ncbi:MULTISPECIES: murein hydrolase activator EnvC family protein [Sporosarcina]|uniref:murein hydrolase activator EnvC family protein n=1 Tax=Sporosarcina TaxID=1569 RepID=UPI00058B3F4F|nr:MULTISPECIES: peptidoglycan DD-metalloendopeptidase family protein [Sporosarcina]WJY26076.1 peptidoglycan DD-metalloendopeptidase family protein [Sporosarcina sp. 0.2-SM1T-5]
MKKNKSLLLSTMGVLLLSSTVGATAVSADSLKDMQNEQKLLQQKQNELNKGIKDKSDKINEKKTKKQTILDQISKLNGEIDTNNEKIRDVKEKIADTTKEIAQLRISIKTLEQRIKERDEVLRERVKTMQVKGGDVSYLDVLLGATSFSDFIDRFSAVSTLMDADRKIMKQQEDDMNQLEEEKALVEKKLAEQEDRKAKLTDLKKKLEGQKVEKDKLVDQLEAEEAKLSNEKAHLESEADEAHDMSADLEKKIVAEQERLAEVARQAELKRKREAELRRQQEAAAAKRRAEQAASSSHSSASSSSSSSNASSSYEPSVAAPPVSSGAWTAPAHGRLTSSFGWRVHPIFHTKKQHRGQDISVPVGTTVSAAAEGVVSHAGPMGGFGNLVMITHSIDGQIYTSVYAHLSSIGVSTGQHVGKGEPIAKSGNTGNSTGPHLHFEIHVGNFSATGPSAVNPLRYVSF